MRRGRRRRRRRWRSVRLCTWKLLWRLNERVSCRSRRARGGRERRGGRGGRLGPPPSPLFAVLVVDHGGGTLQAGFLQFFSSRCVLRCRWQARDAWHQGRFGPEEKLRAFSFTMACARLVLLVLSTSRCVFPLVCRPMMLGIKAGMDQTDILALVDTGICMVKVQLLDEVVVPVVCNDICPGPAACTVGDDFRLVSVFCVALGSTVDTCGASVYKAFWKNFSHLSLKRWIAVLEVDSRLSVLPVFSAMLGSTVAGGESFSPDDAYDSAWNSVKPMKGKYTINYFQYQDVVGCVCMHNDASAASTIFAPTTTTISSSS